MRIQYSSARVLGSGHRRFESVELEKRAKDCYVTEGRVRQGVGYAAITIQSSVLLSRQARRLQRICHSVHTIGFDGFLTLAPLDSASNVPPFLYCLVVTATSSSLQLVMPL